MKPIDPDDFVREALTTAGSYGNKQESLLVAALGLNGEAGEYAEIVKKAFFHGHGFDKKRAAEELGDLLWYAALACYGMNVSMNEIMNDTLTKLRKRYPNGFSHEKSLNREE